MCDHQPDDPRLGSVPNPGDLRSTEVIVDGLGILGGAHLAVDATMVSLVRADDLPWSRCPEME